MKDIRHVAKKVREAEFFSSRVSEIARDLADGGMDDGEDLDFYVSAFLSAAHTVSDILARAHPEWRRSFEGALQPFERSLLTFLRDERNWEVHERARPASHSRSEAERRRVLGLGKHSLGRRGGTVEVFGPPDMVDPVTIITRERFFKMGDETHTVTSICSGVTMVLRDMLRSYERASTGTATARGPSEGGAGDVGR